MSAEEILQQAVELIPNSNRRNVLTLLAPHFSPEMLAASVRYLERFETAVMGSDEIVKLVFELVAELTDVPDFRQRKTRQFQYVFPRQLAMFVIYNEIPEYSYRNCAELFAHKFDHATAINACHSIKDRYATDKTTRQRVDNLVSALVARGLFGTQKELESINIYGKV